MKKIFLFTLTACVLFSSCKKDKDPATPTYTCATCKSTPDALVANNSSSKGIYKGVVIGSTGTIVFDVANNGTLITAVMVLDGTTINLSSTVIWVSGAPYAANFTGTLNGAPVTINFSVGVTGSSPTVTASNIPGHPNSTFTVIKETSTTLVECFEGNFNTTLPESGTFNIIMIRSAGVFGGASRKTGSTISEDFNGTISNNELFVQRSQSIRIGTIKNDQITGTFADRNGTITISARRTL